MIVDITYPIEAWPNQNELTHNTEGITHSTGGAVCNTITDLARLDPQLNLVASGYAGHDAEGDFMLEELKKYPNIDLSMVRRNGRTSFTAVMSNNQTKERTFFQHAGANAYYGEEDIDWDKLDAAGFDQVPTGSIFGCRENIEGLTKYAVEHISEEHLFGIMQSSWERTDPDWMHIHRAGAETLAAAKKWYESR